MDTSGLNADSPTRRKNPGLLIGQPCGSPVPDVKRFLRPAASLSRIQPEPDVLSVLILSRLTPSTERVSSALIFHLQK